MAYFLLSFLLLSLASSEPLSGSIYRTTKQQILATIPPGPTTALSQPFLTSLSGNYVASFLRSKTTVSTVGFGNDFCYVQIEETSSGQTEWQSECVPVSDANACTLAFTDAGLEVFDGSRSIWSTEADGDHVVELTLVDQGDMRIIDKQGELAWKASDDVRTDNRCVLTPESPPFAGPIGSVRPFGQQPQIAGNSPQQQQPAGAPTAVGESPESVGVAPVVASDSDQQQQLPGAPAIGEQPQQQPLGDSDVGGAQQLGINAQPLVDNSPFDSGSFAVVAAGYAVVAALFVQVLVLSV